ncbi:MAG: DUF1559 domain-containing protein [Planctomycetaceae bacterium]|nr:DUF1559 domain-containing protein [Planctomycetaceae bacterium]
MPDQSRLSTLKKLGTPFRWFLLFSAIGVVVFSIYQIELRVRHARNRSACTGNLKQIGVALLNYHEDYGSFPPAYFTNSDGEPIHSWRIVVAKYLDPERFREYRYEEPWNSPHNLRIAKHIPRYFSCLNDADGHLMGQTSYVVVMGEETAFPFAKASRLKDVHDDHDSTILVVEAIETDFFWTEPRDLRLSEMSFRINSGNGKSLSSTDKIGPAIVTVNARIFRVPSSTSSRQLRGMLTIAGNEKITWPR